MNLRERGREEYVVEINRNRGKKFGGGAPELLIIRSVKTKSLERNLKKKVASVN